MTANCKNVIFVSTDCFCDNIIAAQQLAVDSSCSANIRNSLRSTVLDDAIDVDDSLDSFTTR